MKLTIWSNAGLEASARALLAEQAHGHELRDAARSAATNLETGPVDPAALEAEVLFGQPPASLVMTSAKARWVHLSSAGYTRYDTREVRDAARAKGTALTTSSSVYADPCAEHVLAMMLGVSRRLPDSLDEQRGDRRWSMRERRRDSALLRGQRVVMLGFGAIGKRLAELLGPFEVEITALRRSPTGEEAGVTTVGEEDLAPALAAADHVVDLLPDNERTRSFVDARFFERMRRGASFYNVGRGTTVDQEALLGALRSGALGAAYLDVTEPEPLPPEHPLWEEPRCWITPHSAGGHAGEDARLAAHFLANLRRFAAGEPLRDRVM